MTKLAVDKALADRAFEAGFAAGADTTRRRRRHQIDPATHADWKAGYDEGRAALTDATNRRAGIGRAP